MNIYSNPGSKGHYRILCDLRRRYGATADNAISGTMSVGMSDRQLSAYRICRALKAVGMANEMLHPQHFDSFDYYQLRYITDITAPELMSLMVEASVEKLGDFIAHRASMKLAPYMLSALSDKRAAAVLEHIAKVDPARERELANHIWINSSTRPPFKRFNVRP
ncbi:MAG: hypothetical protein ABIE84_05085 [bacterium]